MHGHRLPSPILVDKHQRVKSSEGAGIASAPGAGNRTALPGRNSAHNCRVTIHGDFHIVGLKYSQLQTNNVKVSVYGDTAVVRGVSPRQRSSIPGSGGGGDASPFTAFYTLMFINKDGAWKAVAMHSSRP